MGNEGCGHSFFQFAFRHKFKARLSTIKDRGCVWLRMRQIACMLR